jgi:hypothetical protein
VRRPRSKIWYVAITVLAALALLAVCGLGSWFIVADERLGSSSADGTAPAPTTRPRDIRSRTADPAPLTAKEVFPQAAIVINPAEPPYKVLKTQASAACGVAVAGDIAKMLADLGCSQVVRGTMRSPTGAYLVTGGLFNLDDVSGAEWARDKLKALVDSKEGRFQGMVAGKGTESIALSSAHVGWDVRGHYLIYCVIARADGKAFADGDPYARQILYDIVELHLRDKVLEKRATVPVGGTVAPT